MDMDELITLYHGTLLTPEERARVEAHFAAHPEARREADGYAAAVRLMQKGARQIPKVERAEWDGLMDSLHERLQSEVVLEQARVHEEPVIVVPLRRRLLRMAAAVLLACSVGYAGAAVWNPPVEGYTPTPEELAAHARRRQADAALSGRLPDGTGSRERHVLRRLLQDDFLAGQAATVRGPLLAGPEPVRIEDFDTVVEFAPAGGNSRMVWIVDDNFTVPSERAAPSSEHRGQQ